MEPPSRGPTRVRGPATKRVVLTFLKRSPGATLADIATALGISRTGALKHLVLLEAEGWLARDYRSGRRGRPRVCFRLTTQAQGAFPAAYAETALTAMEYLEKHHGRAAVREMLEDRAQALRSRHAARLAGKALAERVGELGRIRDEEGYMAEVKRTRSEGLLLLEHNCPILAIAQRYGEACDVERRLFQTLLGAEVLVSHRVVAGDPVCRFLVRPRPIPG